MKHQIQQNLLAHGNSKSHFTFKFFNAFPKVYSSNRGIGQGEIAAFNRNPIISPMQKYLTTWPRFQGHVLGYIKGNSSTFTSEANAVATK